MATNLSGIGVGICRGHINSILFRRGKSFGDHDVGCSGYGNAVWTTPRRRMTTGEKKLFFKEEKVVCKVSPEEGLETNDVDQSKGFGSKRRDDGGGSKKAKRGPIKRKGRVAPGPVLLGGQEGIGRIQMSDSIDRTVKNVERAMGTKRIGKDQTVDLKAARSGRVDFAEVDSWGQGLGEDEKELENLKIRSFSSSFTSADAEAPFYEQLVRRLQLLESRGEISVAKSKPLPSFEKWRFRESTYLQFLADQFAVHEALENVIADFDSRTVVTDESLGPSPASMAIAIFGSNLGIFRSKALAADIVAIRTVMLGQDFEIGEMPRIPPPTTQTSAYVKYLQLIGTLAKATDDLQKTLKAQHRLLAHIFAVHVVHLTTGMRVGAKSVEVLPALQKSGAVSFYRDYPSNVPDPLRTFMDAINEAGVLLGGQEIREQVMSHLLKAVQKTSLLLAPIAVEEEVEMVKDSAIST